MLTENFLDDFEGIYNGTLWGGNEDLFYFKKLFDTQTAQTKG